MVTYQCDNCLLTLLGENEILHVTVKGNIGGLNDIDIRYYYCIPCAKETFRYLDE